MRKIRKPLTTILRTKRLKLNLTALDMAAKFKLSSDIFWLLLESRISVAVESLQYEIAEFFKCGVAELFDSDGRAKLADVVNL